MIVLGSDHAGFKLKEHIRKFLEKKGCGYVDMGTYKYNKTDDYPDFAKKVAMQVVKDKSKGILVCGSGIGVCIAANKVKKIRAALCHDVRSAKASRIDGDTNILCLSGNRTKKDLASKIVTAWLNTKPSNAVRHKRRIKKIAKIENA